MDSIFDYFRNSVESTLNHSFSFGRYFSSSRRLDTEEDEVKTAFYDMVNEGDRTSWIIELPGIEKENIHVKAMDDSVEIYAAQSQEGDKRKKNFVYNQRTYSSFYCTIPVPDKILSSEVMQKWMIKEY